MSDMLLFSSCRFDFSELDVGVVQLFAFTPHLISQALVC